MNKKIDLIMSSVQQFCREGYLLSKERNTLYDLADLHGIDKTELDSVLAGELDKVRKGRLNNLYKAAKQPDAALSNNVEMFLQSRRQFPDMLKLGTLKLKLNHDVTAPAFAPIKGMAGFCVIHDDNAEMACNIIQNAVMRLLLSIPRSLAQVSIIDPSSMGSDYIGLSSIDSRLLKVIDDEKQVLPFLQAISKESASFNFKGLGNSFADIAEYNRANRSKARPYQLIILSDFQNLTNKSILAEIKKINKLSVKTGVFFLFALDSQTTSANAEILDVFKNRLEERPNVCVLDTLKKELQAEESDEVRFFNNAFDFEIDTELMFNVDTIQQLNHEYDPITYPFEQVGEEHGDYCVESLNVDIGKPIGKEKAHTISFHQTHDNVIIASQDEEKRTAIAKYMLQSVVSGYRASELSYVFYNCSFIPENAAGTNIIGNIHTNKLGYLLTLLSHLEQVKDVREGLFQEANVSSYEAYRNMVETPMPRIMCILDNIESLLDSDSMNAVESVTLLDQMLRVAGQYGIHFLLIGKPTANLFKLNLTENVRYKLYGSISEDEMMLLGIFANEDEQSYQSQKNGFILYEGAQTQSTKLETLATDKWNDSLTALTTERGLTTLPKVFVDIDEAYPQAYRIINANNISEDSLTDGCPIGIPRDFATKFAKLGNENVMIVGDDFAGMKSILSSEIASLKRNGHLANLCIYDALGENTFGLADVRIHTDINTLSLAENGVLCLLNMDAFDTLYINNVRTLIEEAEKKHAQVLLFAKNDIFTDGLGLTSASFPTKIALTNAPEGFISPIYFYTNNELSMPTVSMQAVSELSNSEGGVDVKAMWLFNY